MSIRANGSGDHLALTGSFAIGTGAFSLGVWTKVVNVRASTFIDFVGLGTEEADPTSSVAYDSDANTTPAFKCYDNITGSGNHDALSTASAGTWFWIVVSRTGTTITSYVFNDTSSTTPLTSFSTGGSSGNISSLDWLAVAQQFAGEWPDAEFANVKLHVGVAWSNAQARAESQHSAAQTAGGTFVVACSLESLALGLTNTGTLGGVITNTGCVDGASNPTQLTYDSGGGGGGFVPDDDYQIFLPVRGN